MAALGSFNGTAFITGAGSGLGQAAALAFAHAGAKLILVDMNIQGLHQTRDLLKDMKDHDILLKQLDLTDRVNMESFVQSIPSLQPPSNRIDYAINSAGIAPRYDVPIAETDALAEEKVYSINLMSQHHLCREQVKVMLKQEPLPGSLASTETWRKTVPLCRGCIVNFASWSAFHGSSCGAPAAPSYPVSKAAVVALTRNIAHSHARHGIRVNAVAPGPTATPILGEGREDMLEEFGQKLVPQGRVGQPHEVADLCLFLCSERASYVNGAVVNIDGALNCA